MRFLYLRIVQALFNVLRSRKGFGDWWDQIDARTQREILDDLNVAVKEELT